MSHNPNGGAGVGDYDTLRDTGDSRNAEAEAEARLEGMKAHVLAERMERERAYAVPGTCPSDGDTGPSASGGGSGGNSGEGAIARQSSNDRAERYMAVKQPESEPAAPVEGARGPEVFDVKE